MIKRPLLWMSIAFIAGIVLYEQPMPFLIVLAVAGILYAVSILLLEKRQSISQRDVKRRRESIPRKDFFLLVLPLCLFAGVWCANKEATELLQRENCFRQALDKGEEVYLEGTIKQVTKKKKDNYELILKDCVLSNCEEDTVFSVGNILLYISAEQFLDEKFKRGDSVVYYGEAASFETATNFGQFDSASYYRQKGITGKVFGIRMIRLENGHFTLTAWFDIVKNNVYEVYDSIFSEEDAGVLLAMLLGEKAFLDTELKQLYQKNGIAHILAVSGLHVSMLGMAVYQLVRRSPAGRNKAICLACLFVVLYGCFTNFSVSAERAVYMFLLSMLATLTGRTYDMPTALTVCAVLTLIRQPLMVNSASFLLSYSAVGGVILYQTLTKYWKRMQEQQQDSPQKKYRFAWLDTLGVSLCIQIVMLPVLLYFFYEISLYSIVLNLFVLPFASLLLCSGIMTAFIGGTSRVAGIFCSGAAGTILAWYETICKIFEKLPCSLLLLGKPEGWQMVCYYSIILISMAAYMQWKKRRFWAGIFLAWLLFFLPWKADNAITFLDVSQGDCIVLRDKQAGAILIDCGSTDETKVGNYRLLPYLKANRIAELEAVVVTHADADHMNGIVELLEQMEPLSRFDALFYKGTVRIKRLLLPDIVNTDEAYQNLERLAKEKKIPISYLSSKEQLVFGDWKLTCLYPEKDAVAESKNNSSLVWYASCGAFDALLTGDVERSGEEAILRSGIFASYGISELDLLKVAHHGSNTSSGEAFLKALKPNVAVISCGKNNRYGHPHEETLERLENVGCNILNTADFGQITFSLETDSQTVYKMHKKE